MNVSVSKYQIVPKRDVGFVVTDGHCNVMPGAIWFQTIPDAFKAIGVLEASRGNAEAFWPAIGKCSPLSRNRPRLGDQRYLASWCDAKSLEADARKNGWTPELDHGPLSYVESSDHDVSITAPNFDAAVAIARSKVAADFFGCPRVYLQEFGPADVPAPAREWENVKCWDVPLDGEPQES